MSTTIFSDNFNTGEINTAKWLPLYSGGELRSSGTGGNGSSGTDGLIGTDGFSLLLRGGGGAVRKAETQSLSTITREGVISFDLIQGSDDNGGEDPDLNEGLLLEYSIDGGTTYTTFVHYMTDQDFARETTPDVVYPTGATPSTTPFWGFYDIEIGYSEQITWKTFTVPIPSAVIGESDVRFRWRQKDYTSSQDHYDVWSIDNVEITLSSIPSPAPSPAPDPFPTPTLIAPVAGSIAEVDNSSRTTSSGLSGNLLAFDRDGTAFSFALTGGTADGENTTLAASYGSFSLNTSTGAYTYTPQLSAIEALAAGEKVVDSFAVSASRGSGRPTATASYNVNISGANDAPTLKAPTDGSISEDSNASSFSSSALSGTLSAADIDGDSLTFAISGGTSNGTTSTKAGSYGSLSLNSTSGLYTYTPDSMAIDALKGGETATDSFTLSVSDGSVSTTTSYNVNLIGADEIISGNPNGEDGIIPINQSDSVINKKINESNVYSRKGKNIMRGSLGETNFIFSNKEALTKDNADVIVKFKNKEGDQIQIDGDLHGLPDDPKFKRTKYRRKLGRFARSNVDIVYFKRRHLYLNTNGEENGFGDDNEDGLLAIFKGKPRLTQDSFEIT